MSFLCKANRTEQRIIDATALAADYSKFPHSLGVRPQAVPLRFVTPELRPHLFLSHQPFKTVFSWIEKKLLSVERMNIANPGTSHISREKVYHRAYIGETTSLIYLPVFIRGNALYDAITKKRVASVPDMESGALSFQKLRAGQISFIPTLCPGCGWELQGEKDSLVLFCRNCDTAWKASGNGLENLDFAVIPGKKDSPLYFPFWRMKVRIAGVSLKSYADLIRFANLPKAIQKSWEEQEIHFWSSAFKIRPELFQRTAKSATNAQLMVGAGQGVPRARVFPVTLLAEEALQGLKITLVNLAVPKRKILPLIDEITITPQESLLVLVPFSKNTHEYVQKEMRLSLNINALKYGRNI
ncbi:hypothetical protein MNBD_NITROSPIRAE02-206 [hydrothermal vent metagenome]|uniref:Uncharacterized protein n=1 Tax=hydrothermal vent metagenome TaxID=652676 RepID=A0A3B1CQQ8_9ZZZZ